MPSITITMDDYVAATGKVRVMPRYVGQCLRKVIGPKPVWITGIMAGPSEIVVAFSIQCPCSGTKRERKRRKRLQLRGRKYRCTGEHAGGLVGTGQVPL